jgi:hypothetical protein
MYRQNMEKNLMKSMRLKGVKDVKDFLKHTRARESEIFTRQRVSHVRARTR